MCLWGPVRELVVRAYFGCQARSSCHFCSWWMLLVLLIGPVTCPDPVTGLVRLSGGQAGFGLSWKGPLLVVVVVVGLSSGS